MTARRKILIIALLLLPVLLAALFSIIETEKQFIGQIYKERSTEASLATHILKTKFDHVNDIGLSLATQPALWAGINAKKWDTAIAVMKKIPADLHYITNLFLTDSNGRVLAETPLSSSSARSTFPGFTWHRNVSSTYFSEVYKIPQAPQVVFMALSIPLYNSRHQLTCFLILQVNVEALLEWSTDISIGKSGYVYIVDQTGHVAFSPGLPVSDSLIDYSSVPSVQRALLGEKNVAILYNPIAKENRLSAYEQLPGAGWAVIVQEEAGAALPIYHELRFIFLFYSLMIFLAAFAAWLILKEITLRKKKETDLRTYTDLVENTQVLIRNMNNEIIFWNRGMETLYGWTKKEVIGKTTHQFFSTVFPQPLAVIEKMLFAYDQWQGELEHLKKDGSTIFVSSHWSLTRNKKGIPSAVIETNYDITELKKAEAQVASLARQIDQSNNAIYTVDQNRRIKTWNQGAEKLYGFSREEAVGQEANRLLQTALSEAAIDLAVSQLAKEDYWSGELKRTTKHGKAVDVHSSTTTIRESNGTITGYVAVSLDITEQVKLREQVDLLAAIVDQSEDTIASVSMDIKIMSWNRGAEKLHGYSREEAIGKTPQELGMIQLTDEQVNEIFNSIIEHGAWKSEMLFYHKQKGSFFGVINANQVKKKNGEITGVGFVIKDISARKKLEEQLGAANAGLEEKIKERTREMYVSEKKFRAMVENNQDIIALLDGAFNATYRSPSSFRITGWTNDELKLNEKNKIHPEDMAKTDEVLQNLVANPGKLINISFRTLHKNGQYIWVEGTLINLLHDENIQSIVTNFRDITDKIKVQEKLITSEKRFRALIENNYDVISLMDESFRVFYRSPSAARITGWTDEEMINDDGKKNIHPDDREMAAAVISDVMANPGKQVHTLFRNLHKRGHYVWVEGIVINRLRDENVSAIVFNYRDVTERKEAEEKLAASEIRFRSLIENSAEGVSLLDASTNVIYRSPGGYKLVGESPVKDSISYAHPDDLKKFKTRFSEALDKPGIPVPYEVRFPNTAGGYFWTEGTFTNLLNVEGVNAVVANYRDITKRKELENLLNKANALARIGGWEVDLLKGTVYWTDITREIHETGYDYIPDLESGLNFYQEGEGRDLIRQKVKEAIEEGKPWDVELPIITAKKNERWIRSIGETEFADGKCVRIYGSFQDINQRREAQEQLKASETRFRSLIENISDGIVLTDKDSNILYQSPSVTKIIGYRLEERKGKNLVDFTHPDDIQALNAFNEQLGKTKNTPLPFQFRFRHKKGHYIWLEGFVRNLLHDPAVNASVSNYRDITERKEAEKALQKSEKLFRSLFENMHNGFAYFKAVFKKDKLADAGYLAANTEYESLVGVTHLPGKKVADVLPGFLNPDGPYGPVIERVLLTGKPEKFESFMQPLKKWLSVAIYSPARGYFVVLTDDITDRKMVEQKIKNINAELEERVIKRTEELKKVNEELEAFSYSVSHDLRAPLRGIIGFTAILEEDYSSKLDDEAKRITSIIKQNTLKMGNLIDDLLMFSRMGRQQTEQSHIDNTEMVSHIIAGLDSKPANNPVNWVIHPLHSANGDIAAMRQVWTNLISNAVKYSGTRQHPRIEIQSYAQENQLVYMIKDNGVGFDQKYSNKLFRVFQRLHAADEFEGTGVGLAIVEKIISKHGGKVWAEAVINEGATFYFSLPSG